jgi:hypothetical protein
MNATAIDPSRTAEATRFDVVSSFIAMVKRQPEITKAKLKPKPDRQGGAPSFVCGRSLTALALHHRWQMQNMEFERENQLFPNRREAQFE